jgi:hypothetical protein
MRTLLSWLEALLLVPFVVLGLVLAGLPLALAVRGVIELARWLFGP